MPHLESLTSPALVFPEIPGSDAPTILRALSERFAVVVDEVDAEDLYRKLMEREQLGSTGIGAGVAIPHCKVGGLDHAVLAVAVTKKKIDFGAMDDQPVQVFFLVVSPEDSPAEHLQVLAAISRWVKAGKNVQRILDRPSRERIYGLLQEVGAEA